MSTHSTAHNAPVVLDGPSALAFYRDRCHTINHLDETPQVSVAHSVVIDEKHWLTDEDVAASLAETSIFGRCPAIAQEFEEDVNGLPLLNRSRMAGFADCSANSRDIKRIPYDLLGIRPPSRTSPLFVLVGNANSRHRVKHVNVRCCSKNPPSGSLWHIGHRVYVPTPEFSFLLLASHLSLVELVMVGMELCGAYRLIGANTPALLHSTLTLYNQEPFTTPDRLRAFIDRAKGFPGALLAQRACGLIAPASASPMETAVYLLLCLPRSLGGYAIPRPVLNARRHVTKRAETLTTKHTLVPDLYWPAVRLDVEYDSEEFHSDSARLELGLRRTLALRAMHVEVISLTKEVVYDDVAFDTTARMVAKRLGKRLRSQSETLQEKRRALRDTVLHT